MKKTIVREYQLPSSCNKGKQELTIAFLTDLHDQVTGEWVKKDVTRRKRLHF